MLTMAPDFDVVIVGAGPVGLTLANILGLQGVRTLVVEERETLIDYPRGVGLDDEELRAFQAIGLVDRILPHTVPNQIWRFMSAKHRVVAEMAPTDAPFGWPKRNGFVQPLVDAELLSGLKRFDHVAVVWGYRMRSCTETSDDVRVELISTGRHLSTVRAGWVVGCDGGRSNTRQLMGVSFDGTTSPTRWLVVDLATDPLGHPNTEAGGDPARPYVSISIAHGIRRFEFMIHADETDEQAESPEFVARMLAPFVPYPERVDVIRRRVYTHHSRIAGAFRRGRFLMRFKPMPRYERGAVVHAEPRRPDSPVGTLFIQPRVDTFDQQNALLDDVLGPRFAILCWNNNPRRVLGAQCFAHWKEVRTRFVDVRPGSQVYWTGTADPDVAVVGDRNGTLQSWFNSHRCSVVFLRPDRFVAGACVAQLAAEVSASLFDVLTFTSKGNDVTSSLMHVTSTHR
jgi:2-polyprenyl-6-methoxyphenol hydroxylase-like FAD-dependent oxidoreductase